MNQRTIVCPYCASQVMGDSTVCPGCQEDLAALAHLVYADAIHYNQALAMAREGRVREAKAELAESLTANNAFSPAYALLAKINARELDWANARMNVKKALSLAPEDEVIVQLADEVISAAPGMDLPANIEPVATSPVVTPVGQSQSAVSVLPNTDHVPVNSTALQPAGNHEEASPVPVTPPVLQAFLPAQPGSRPADQRSGPAARRGQPYRPPNRALQPAGPSSYLYQPQDVGRGDVAVPVASPVEPEVPSLPEPARLPNETIPDPEILPPTDTSAPASDAYEPLFKGSIWRTLGMGILITAGLAILIRAMSGED
jgi:hypothetical protein